MVLNSNVSNVTTYELERPYVLILNVGSGTGSYKSRSIY